MYKMELIAAQGDEIYRTFTDVMDYYYNENTDTIILYGEDDVTRAIVKASCSRYYSLITQQ